MYTCTFSASPVPGVDHYGDDDLPTIPEEVVPGELPSEVHMYMYIHVHVFLDHQSTCTNFFIYYHFFLLCYDYIDQLFHIGKKKCFYYTKVARLGEIFFSPVKVFGCMVPSQLPYFRVIKHMRLHPHRKKTCV